MPHQCTNCGRAFDDGSKEMLSGCPDCGGNKFQFLPADADPVEDPPEEAPEPPEPPGSDGSVARKVGNAAATVRDMVGVGSSPERPEAGQEHPASAREDAAQADARSEVVGPGELPDGPTAAGNVVPDDETATVASAPEEADDPDRPDLEELREELNDQFESIRVVERGQYELNLMELFDRDEYIIALQEDGRYTIQVPETWRD